MNESDKCHFNGVKAVAISKIASVITGEVSWGMPIEKLNPRCHCGSLMESSWFKPWPCHTKDVGAEWGTAFYNVFLGVCMYYVLT